MVQVELLFVIIAMVIVIVVQGEYKNIETEDRHDSATDSSESVDMACLSDTEIQNALKVSDCNQYHTHTQQLSMDYLLIKRFDIKIQGNPRVDIHRKYCFWSRHLQAF